MAKKKETEAKKDELPEDVVQCDQEIERLHNELDELDAKRLALKEKGQKLTAEKASHHLKREVILRYLAGGQFSPQMMDWTEANPDEWKKIKETHRGNRGTRRAQSMKSGG